MKYTVECQEVNDSNRAKRTVIKSARNDNLRATYTLTHTTAGYEPAGSMARYTEESWGVLYTTDNGAMGGEWFKSLEYASNRFDAIITPGQIAYERDCEIEPYYPDRTTRLPWDKLSPIAKESWERNPTVRATAKGWHRDA
jgi:hypothetical protein